MGKSQVTRFSYFLKRGFSLAPRKPYAEIDPKVRPLVDRMNSTGLFRTIASCEGHAGLLKPPYVYFKAHIEDAALFERLIREAAWRTDSDFLETWVVEGRFDDEFDLTFILYSPVLHGKSSSLLFAIYFRYFRRRIDSDLSLLADLVEKIAVLKSRDSDKPQIASTTCHHYEAE